MAAVRRIRLYEQISERLERRIRDESLSLGQELPSERELMKEFGVGRPAVREALFHLQKMGLVELRSGTRARVCAPTPVAVVNSLAGSARYLLSAPQGMRHFQEARAFFEAGLAREAARVASPDNVQRLGDALEQNRLSINDLKRFEQTDVAFHHAIATIPNNPIYTALHKAIFEWLLDQRHVSLSYPGQNHIATAAHQAIFDAIAARDPDRAEKVMRDHLKQVADVYWTVRGEEA
jgi:GntR family transcriptional regulator, sialic acid-inducible nan operon repressor